MGLNVLKTCQEVVSQSKDVKIVPSKISKLAEEVLHNITINTLSNKI